MTLIKSLSVLCVTLVSSFSYARTCDAELKSFLASKFQKPFTYEIVTDNRMTIGREGKYLRYLTLIAGSPNEGGPRNTYWYSVQIVCETVDNTVYYEGLPTLKILTKYRAD